MAYVRMPSPPTRVWAYVWLAACVRHLCLRVVCMTMRMCLPTYVWLFCLPACPVYGLRNDSFSARHFLRIACFACLPARV